MITLVKQGQHFIREFVHFFYNVARVISFPKFLLSTFLGVVAKLSLMTSFLVIVKLISLYVLGDDVFLSSDYMGIFLMIFIPALLSLSASSLYFDMALKMGCESIFIKHVRRSNLDQFVMQHDFVDKAQLTNFIGLNDGVLTTGATTSFHASFEFLQSVLISILVLILLFYAYWIIGLLLFLSLLIMAPFFVYFGKKQQEGSLNDIEKVKLKLGDMKKELYQKTKEPVFVKDVMEDLRGIMFGDEAFMIKKDQNQKKIGSRKAFPFIYGLIGLMFAVLVYANFSTVGDGISAEEFSLWVVVFFALRFMAGAVQNMRNTLFSLLSNYQHILKINILLI